MIIDKLSYCIRQCASVAVCLLVAIFFHSCERIELSEADMEDVVQGANNEVRVTTRASFGIAYPLTLYAFNNSSGALVASTSVGEDADEVMLTLPSGQYHLVALAGLEACAVPASPTLTDYIVLPANGRLETPLQMGSADVPISGDATVNITMYNQVASVDLALEGLPQDVSSASVTLSMLYSRLSFGGVLSGEVSTTVQLQRNASGDLWTAPLFYTLPGSGNRLTLSITTLSPLGTQTYGYTHIGTLQSNTPYKLSGSYTDGFTVNSVISLAGWNNPEEILFNLGSDTPVEPDDDSSTDGGEVLSIPQPGSFWNGHFVALSELEDNGQKARLLLLSLSEWTGVPSATNEEQPELAAELAAEYVEDDLSEWYIPTREEVKAMRALIGGGNLSATNVRLAEYGAVLLSDGVKDLEGNNLRYLCDDGAFSFTWTGSNISTCGSKRTYNLRMVKSVTVSLK